LNPASRYVWEDDSPFPTGYFEGFLSLKGASYHHIHGLVGLVVFSGDPAVLKSLRLQVLASIVLEEEVL